MQKNKREYQICTNCVMDTSDSKIVFDESGVCDHCLNFYDNILPNWHNDERGKRELDEIVNRIKESEKNKKYDCIIGISGGVDSSYLAYYAKEVLGLRPLLFAVDTGWNLNIAVSNVEKIAKGLGTELYTEIVNWNEIKDLQLAYFKSQVPYQDTVQDHVIFASLYNFAAKRGIKYVLTGANYSTECVREPDEWVYQNDLKQIMDIHKKFGNIPLKTLPLCGIFKYKLYYRYIKGMKVIKPLNYIDYTKDGAIKTLQERFGWEPYANKHFESIFTRFYEGYWLVKKFGFDKRRAHFSSLILTGQMTRDEAIKKLEEPPYDEQLAMEDLEYVAKKLDMSKEEFMEMMNGENKTFRDYANNSYVIGLGVKAAKFLGIEKRNFR